MVRSLRLYERLTLSLRSGFVGVYLAVLFSASNHLPFSGVPSSGVRFRSVWLPSLTLWLRPAGVFRFPRMRRTYPQSGEFQIPPPRSRDYSR